MLFHLDLLSENTLVEVEIVGGVTGLAVDAHFEVQMGRGGSARLTCEGYHLTSLDKIALLHQILRVMGIAGFQAVGMLDADVIAITVIDVGEYHLAFESGIDVVVGLCLEVNTRVRPFATFAVRADDLCARQRKMPPDGIWCLFGTDPVRTTHEQYRYER